MIGMLRGRVLEIKNDLAIIDVQGVGYEIHVSKNTALEIDGKELTRVFVYTHVREDNLSLFGFSTSLEKELFLNLIKINGIGPKVALTMLSATRVTDLIELIEAGDVNGLSDLPKIGKKKAEQIVLSLKGQLVFAEARTLQTSFSAKADVISALVNLGFRQTEVEKAVAQLPPETDFAAGVRRGLALLTLQS